MFGLFDVKCFTSNLKVLLLLDTFAIELCSVAEAGCFYITFSFSNFSKYQNQIARALIFGTSFIEYWV